MEEERDHEEFKHVCRLCNKRFPSGKSLGGHMRSHVIAEARKNKLLSSVKKVPNFDDNDDDDDDDEEDEDVNEIIDRNGNGGNNSGYGLRENPKKTWRMVDSYPEKLQQNNQSNNQQERVCKQCGKGFHSLKALCGHMSIHSDKDRHFKEEDDDNSWSSDSIDQLYLAMESHSDNNSKRQTRSSLTRYGSLTAVDSFVNGGGSSSNHSEIDQLEQEEVAMCLMMLSRDSSGSKNCFNFGAAESSDNNSVILEGGLSKNVLVAKGNVDYCKGKNHVDQEMDNSDSGYFENGAKVLESDDSVDGFVKNYGFGKNMFDVGYNDNNIKKRKIRDLGSYGFENPESNENYSSKKMKQDCFYPEKVVSNNKYECWICNKTFKTHQALGGHIISHRKNGENSLNNNNPTKVNSIKKGSTSKKVKGHKCPYCPRVFKSGQALGGHKRSHMLGSNNVMLHSEGRLNHIHVPIPPSPSEPELKHPLIDLNLPAPLEEEGTGNSQFVAW